MGKVGRLMATQVIRSGIIPEPEPTEEDLRRGREMVARIEEDNRRAREAGERLLPITDEIWKIRD
jgi:hypothetical protein